MDQYSNNPQSTRLESSCREDSMGDPQRFHLGVMGRIWDRGSQMTWCLAEVEAKIKNQIPRADPALLLMLDIICGSRVMVDLK